MPIADFQQIQDSRHILELSQREHDPYDVQVAGLSFRVCPGVFSPRYFDSTNFFSEEFPFRRDEMFLEIGSGTGITAVLAALNGARRVVATDINPLAVENTRQNAAIHGVRAIIESRVSDLFSSLSASEQFQTIYWNSNFIYVDPDYAYRSDLERSLFDPGYQYHNEFLRGARQHLAKGGRVLVGFSDRGEVDEFQRLYKLHGYHAREVARGEGVEGRRLTFMLYELTRESSFHDSPESH